MTPESVFLVVCIDMALLGQGFGKASSLHWKC